MADILLRGLILPAKKSSRAAQHAAALSAGGAKTVLESSCVRARATGSRFSWARAVPSGALSLSCRSVIVPASSMRRSGYEVCGRHQCGVRAHATPFGFGHRGPHGCLHSPAQ